MENISLKRVIPNIFEDEETHSEVWLQELSFQKGQQYLVEAASGTGKTSLCSFIYGDRRDFRGEIRFDGQDIRTLTTAQLENIRREHLSIVFQDLKLFPELTAFENVLVKNQLTGHKKESEIRDLFVKLGIEDKLGSRADKLSLGQQQRVSFIRALCQPFDFIILDEPISHLDQANAAVISSILTEEVKRQGASALVTSLGVTLKLDYDKILKL